MPDPTRQLFPFIGKVILRWSLGYPWLSLVIRWLSAGYPLVICMPFHLFLHTCYSLFTICCLVILGYPLVVCSLYTTLLTFICCSLLTAYSLCMPIYCTCYSHLLFTVHDLLLAFVVTISFTGYLLFIVDSLTTYFAHYLLLIPLAHHLSLVLLNIHCLFYFVHYSLLSVYCSLFTHCYSLLIVCCLFHYSFSIV